MQIEKNIFLPMQDGTRLALALFTPDGDGPRPVVLAAYPYHKDGHVGFGCALEMLSEIRFTLEGTAYRAGVRQRVTQSQIEIATRVEEGGEIIHEKAFSKGYRV